MRLVDASIDLYEIAKVAGGPYNEVKGVVDAFSGRMVIDMDNHADGVDFLSVLGSNPADMWGITLYPDKFGTPAFILFDSDINVRPAQRNRSRTIEDEKLRAKLTALITQKINAKVSPN